jgi:hypothetical protein
MRQHRQSVIGYIISYLTVTVITPLFTETLKGRDNDPVISSIVPSALYWAQILPLYTDDGVSYLLVYLKRHTTVAAPPEKGILKVLLNVGIFIPPQFTGLYHVTPPPLVPTMEFPAASCAVTPDKSVSGVTVSPVRSSRTVPSLSWTLLLAMPHLLSRW